jgi:hypothetical protein
MMQSDSWKQETLTMSKTQETKEYREGKEAGENGQPPSANPYPVFASDRKGLEWQKGWRAAYGYKD